MPSSQPFPPDLEADIRTAYEELAGSAGDASFAVRSSATAEDLPGAPFAEQQETFLNVRERSPERDAGWDGTSSSGAGRQPTDFAAPPRCGRLRPAVCNS
jgi:Pyruvate phosphate dikinase, AMP/ATP-binding domain